MRKITLLLAALLAIPGAAQAQQPQQAQALLMPVATLDAVVNYLQTKPYAEVAPIIGAITACASVQVPQNGTLVDRGQCPVVSQARQQQDAEKAAEIKRAVDAAVAAVRDKGDKQK